VLSEDNKVMLRDKEGTITDPKAVVMPVPEVDPTSPAAGDMGP
jgi:hypothetical protein